MIGPFTNAQLVALGFIFAGAGGWLWLRARRTRTVVSPQTSD